MDTLKQRIALAGVKGAKFVPRAIDLTLPVDIYTEKTVEVLLRGINFPADKVLRAFPSKSSGYVSSWIKSFSRS